MQHIDYGLGVLSRDVIERIPANGPVDLASVYETLVRDGKLAAFEVGERFYEAGSFRGIADLSQFLRTT